MNDEAMNHILKQKLASLQESLKRTGGLTVAYSGGVDSTFLLKVAHDTLGDDVLAVTACSPSLPKRELMAAEAYAQTLGVRHRIVETEEFDLPDYCNNPVDRCYFCKREFFTKITAVAARNDLKHVADGSNLDDLGDYRPGIKALGELGIVCPLKEAGMGKQEIRILSKQMGLPTWDKPALACLSTRIPYGHKITREKVSIIEKAEQFLQDSGFRQVRVRHHGDVARIEVSVEERGKFFDTALMDRIADVLKQYGFSYVALDLRGYRTGSLNEVITTPGGNQSGIRNLNERG
ncbi:MAG: ATP-dependent sacrificial sulfur transferase LarE [Syntrophaceae bacterium]|nr:ATP-dependent sacrificial sulfur transferase LarE [Syntrophaceae bacterium]